MERKKTPLSIEVIYWITNITLGMLVLVFFIFLIINIFLYTSDDRRDIGFSLALPVRFEIKEMGSLRLNEQDVKMKLVDATSKVYFVDAPRSISTRVITFSLCLILFAFYMVFVFRKFIMNVKEGNTFSRQNIKLLKKISYLLIVVWVFQAVFLKIISLFLVSRMKFEHINLIKSVRLSADILDYRSVLFIAIFIWVLAHIFMTGLKLQEDKDLTI